MADAFDDEAEPTISIDEYLEKIEEEELEADLVLGADEGDECTYQKGYMKRQAIFSCLTCTPDGNAGICTACCLSCHDGHEVLELWTKRNFRCDCGNSKFGEFICKLCASKDTENINNSYNHNFKGLYCTCNRPYPDPDRKEQEEMIQCCMCEDWFHEEHLGVTSSNEIPRDEEGEPVYEDFICEACSSVCSFLMKYPETIWAAMEHPLPLVSLGKDKGVIEGAKFSYVEPQKGENDVCSHNSSAKHYCADNADADKTSSVAAVTDTVKTNLVAGADTGKNTSLTGADTDTACVYGDQKCLIGESSINPDSSSQCTNPTGSQTVCPIGEDATESLDVQRKPLFLSKSWRDALCRCKNCLDMYMSKQISYLLDKEDQIAEYEKKAKQKREEKLQQREGAVSSFFNNLGHVEKMEILSGIADFRDEFRSLLESVDPSKTITAADVQQMFENLKNKRRRFQ